MSIRKGGSSFNEREINEEIERKVERKRGESHSFTHKFCSIVGKGMEAKFIPITFQERM